MHIHKEYSLSIGDMPIVAQFTDLADQAHGSVILKSRNTVVMATAVMGNDDGNNPGWFNLTVEYTEKYYASGKILGARYQKREGRPTDTAILAGRVIDRTLRPLFDQRIKNSVQVIITVLALGDSDPTILGVNAASLALGVSNIPWGGPIGAVRMTQIKNSPLSAQPDLYIRDCDDKAHENYGVDITVCGRAGMVTMIEAMTHEITEDTFHQTLEQAMLHITTLEKWQQNIIAEIGQTKKVFVFPEIPPELETFFEHHGREALVAGLARGMTRTELYAIHDSFFEKLKETFPNDDDHSLLIKKMAKDFYHHKEDFYIHELGLVHKKRADGRSFDEVRKLHAQAGGISPVLHGTGIFYRGETHVLSVLTLGGPDDTKIEEGMEVQTTRRFIHHYNFPPYSSGETGRLGSTGRREIGHGALVEKSFIPVLPSPENFPYTIRVVSESTASNGSTSQASICASTLAMYDGGVPLLRPVAGIAMGLLQDEHNEDNYVILTDIQGPEDHHGDMDFKVAGTRDGITAIQLDIKLSGVSLQALADAVHKAKTARLLILDTIEQELATPRADISPYAPKIIAATINPEYIGMIIGKGGETIQRIQKETGATIAIEDDGRIFFTGNNGSAEKARDIVMMMTREFTPGEQVQGTVQKILEGVGVIVSLTPSKTGMIHISELASFRVEKIEGLVHIGQTLPVTVLSLDKEKDRIALSLKKDHPDFIAKPN